MIILYELTNYVKWLCENRQTSLAMLNNIYRAFYSNGVLQSTAVMNNTTLF